MRNYFTLEEMTKTDSGLSNCPKRSEFRNLERLRFVLNILRHLIGQPISVNSAFRTPEVNAVVGGSCFSYHLYGRAADITCSKLSELYDICKVYKEAGILIECVMYSERNFIHIAI